MICFVRRSSHTYQEPYLAALLLFLLPLAIDCLLLAAFNLVAVLADRKNLPIGFFGKMPLVLLSVLQPDLPSHLPDLPVHLLRSLRVGEDPTNPLSEEGRVRAKGEGP